MWRHVYRIRPEPELATGLFPISKACAACSKAAPSSLPSAMPLPWCAHCHTVTSPLFLAPAAGSVCTASLGPDGDRCRDLVLALIAGRILDPASKLATSRALSPATAASSLGEMLGLGAVDEDELYTALD
jgi:hypothetical protein